MKIAKILPISPPSLARGRSICPLSLLSKNERPPPRSGKYRWVNVSLCPSKTGNRVMSFLRHESMLFWSTSTSRNPTEISKLPPAVTPSPRPIATFRVQVAPSSKPDRSSDAPRIARSTTDPVCFVVMASILPDEDAVN